MLSVLLTWIVWLELVSVGRVHILEDRSLRLDGVTLEDMGEYSCEADNAVGSVSATGTLYVNCEYYFVLLSGAEPRLFIIYKF